MCYVYQIFQQIDQNFNKLYTYFTTNRYFFVDAQQHNERGIEEKSANRKKGHAMHWSLKASIKAIIGHKIKVA